MQLNDEILRTWYDRLSIRSVSTARLYCGAIRYLMDYLKVSTSVELIDRLKANMYGVVNDWIATLNKDEKAPMTIHSYIKAVRVFALSNDVDFNPAKMRLKVTLPNNEALTDDRIPTDEQLKHLYNIATPRGRLVILLMIHGLRVSEVAKLMVSDVELAHEIPHIRLKNGNTKGKKERCVPLTKEAYDFISQYIVAYKRKPDDSFLGVTPENVRFMYTRVLEKAKLDQKDEGSGLNLLHPHTLRKYCKTMLVKAGVQSSMVDRILGHNSYLDSVYLRENLEMVKESFKKAEPLLTIEKESVKTLKDVETIKQENIELRKRMKIMERGLRMTMEALKTYGEIDFGKLQDAWLETVEEE